MSFILHPLLFAFLWLLSSVAASDSSLPTELKVSFTAFFAIQSSLPPVNTSGRNTQPELSHLLFQKMAALTRLVPYGSVAMVE